MTSKGHWDPPSPVTVAITTFYSCSLLHLDHPLNAAEGRENGRRILVSGHSLRCAIHACSVLRRSRYSTHADLHTKFVLVLIQGMPRRV